VKLYHSSQFSTNVNYNVARIKKNESLLDWIITGEVNEAIKEQDKEMLRLSKPSVWNVYITGNAEIQHDVGFELMLLGVAEAAGTTEDLGEWTMFRFYNLRLYLMEKNKGSNG